MVQKLKEKIEEEVIEITENEFDTQMYRGIESYLKKIQNYRAKIDKITSLWSKIEFYKSIGHYVTYTYFPDSDRYSYVLNPKIPIGFIGKSQTPPNEVINLK